jgi:Amt family ammonium transporter
MALQVQTLGTTTVAAAAAGIAWVFLDKILGHKLSAMGACGSCRLSSQLHQLLVL